MDFGETCVEQYSSDEDTLDYFSEDDDTIVSLYETIVIDQSTLKTLYNPSKAVEEALNELDTRKKYVITNPSTIVLESLEPEHSDSSDSSRSCIKRKRQESDAFDALDAPRYCKRSKIARITLPMSINDPDVLSDNDEVFDGDDDVYLLAITCPTIRLVPNVYDCPLFNRDVGYINDDDDDVNSDSESDFEPDAMRDIKYSDSDSDSEFDD